MDDGECSGTVRGEYARRCGRLEIEEIAQVKDPRRQCPRHCLAVSTVGVRLCNHGERDTAVKSKGNIASEMGMGMATYKI